MSEPAAIPSTRRMKFLVGSVVLALLVVGLIVWGLGREGAASFFMTVSEAKAAAPGADLADYRVYGTVVPGSIERNGLETSFLVTDGRTEMPVTTRRAVPDTFKDGSEVVVRGNRTGDAFLASEVLAKCPSKFKAKS